MKISQSGWGGGGASGRVLKSFFDCKEGENIILIVISHVKNA